ncbi:MULTISPECIES: GNAT family N-acetyltransferase [unclassified Streptomyces]|uniref:GNAT family N-acetyltransferase n=1 Tax=unclassified Streptomyces TaxID=2593676 RepID=UPI002ED5E446|nr:GNAT family N-acetyltransferase [Streptomyces sp. NBC_00891]WSY04490.1 GNAT family N-acetyltransferase [Streptomyces sp. NBC_00890]WSZ06115.1 GNAT family N-acetyltransferase [Streptomyces sp. NBC_00869]WSZ26389.1 GNAT family N-acetyltransferase [Streptomyces sp. NBC_00870]
MTTTLRPSGPIQPGADGAQRRAYDVCDNGRPVGSVTLTLEPGAGGATGAVKDLRIDEAVRRRGRGTIAALAAEEILRGWGCTQVFTEVAAGDTAGQRMADALGYTERSRHMLKTLPEQQPVLPAGLTGRPMTPEEFAVWEGEAVAEYAESLISRGFPRERALEMSRTSHARYLPDGLATEGARMEILFREGEAVGHIWVSPFEMHPGLRVAYVFDVEVREAFRGRGHGRALMLQAERIALAAGETRIGLHVVTANTSALRLYESLGYVLTKSYPAKPL